MLSTAEIASQLNAFSESMVFIIENNEVFGKGLD